MVSFVRWTVLTFSLVLIWVGLIPLVDPSAQGPTSDAPAYAWFHLAAACVGLACVAFHQGRGTPWFALGFGALDLYQWIASLAGWFPRTQFRWTSLDDGLHLGLGLALVALGMAGLFLSRRHQ